MIAFTTLTSVGDLLAGPAGAIVLMLLLAVLVYWRTRSMHVLWSRIWTLLIRRRQGADSAAERFYEEQMEILKFRFHTAIPVRTARHVSGVIEWMRRHDQDPATVASCGDYFDVARPGLTPAALGFEAWRVGVMSAITIAFLLAAILAASAISMDRALLKFKATGHWFTLDAVQAKPVGASPGFLLARCAAPPRQLALASGFTEPEIATLCAETPAEDIGAFVRKSIDEQRVAFGALSAVLSFVTLMCRGVLKEVTTMLRLRQSLNEGAQPRTDADA